MGPLSARAPSLRLRLQELLRVDPAAKPALYAQLFDSASLTNLSYWLEIVFAAGIATLGLVLNSPAVIIGAMLISPLMGPLLATGLALAMGDLYLGVRAVLHLAISTAASVALAAFIVWLLPFHSPTAEILSRTNPNLLDLGVAILSGLAGSMVVCRGGGSGVTALPGVAIAVALMPPLCAMGFGMGSGGAAGIVSGAGLLFLTNLVAIVSAAFAVFLLVRMDGADVRAEIERYRQQQGGHDRVYRLIRESPLARMLAFGGRLHWRLLMLVVLLGAVFVPLRDALEQVKADVVARSAVQDAVGRLAPAGGLVSHQVALGPHEIEISLISTRNIEPARIEQTRQMLIGKTGRNVRIAVQEVASKDELRLLLERMSAPPPAPAAPPPTLAGLRKQALEIIGPHLERTWPGADLPLLGYELAFTGEEALLRIDYQAARDLQPEAVSVLQAVLRNELNAPELTLELHRKAPPRARRTIRRHVE
jgi:uncharacterized hydrophobic protein (TIGR00271 family)